LVDPATRRGRGARVIEATMKITHVGPTKGPERRRRAGASSGQSATFSPVRESRGGASGEISATTPLGVLGAVLALQEVSDPPAQRRQAIERGHGLLDELHQLRVGLIEGDLLEAPLRRLTQLLENKPAAVGDQRLGAVLEAIELRAAVELAKLDRAPRAARAGA
jgi:hypothetical protein